MKKATLKLPKSEQSGNTLIFAIASAESDLNICRLLNQVLSINLSLAENIEIIIKNKPLSFRRYSFEEEEGIEKYSLILNSNGTNYLFPEIRNIDYLLLIQSEGYLTSIENSVKQIKSVSGITAVYKLDSSTLKSFNKLFY